MNTQVFWSAILLSLASLAQAAPNSSQPEHPAPTSPKQPQSGGARAQTTPTEIARAYLENTIAADRKYVGQSFELKARVASVGIDEQRRAYLGLYTNIPGTFVKAEIDNSETDALAALKRMDVVVMRCTGAGLDSTRTVPILDCANVIRQANEARRDPGPTRVPYETNLGAMP